MASQIVRQYPIHCQITDGIIGSGYERQPNAYETEACARAIAARLHDECYNSCGDDSFFVIPYDGDVYYRDRVRALRQDDDMPF